MDVVSIDPHGFTPTEYVDECHLCYKARKVHIVSDSEKLYRYAYLREEILDTLFLAARDQDKIVRRASIFALDDCISDETKDKIFAVFEDLLEDVAEGKSDECFKRTYKR